MKLHKPNDMELRGFLESYVEMGRTLGSDVVDLWKALVVFLYNLRCVIITVIMIVGMPLMWPVVYVLYCIFNNPEKVAKRKEEMRKRHDADV